MYEVLVVRIAVAARLLTDRRDEHPIGKRQISNRERIKQAGHDLQTNDGLTDVHLPIPAPLFSLSTSTIDLFPYRYKRST